MKKVLLISSLVGVFLLLTILLSTLFFNHPSFKMMNDSDSNTYCSNEYGSSIAGLYVKNYMSYSNGTLLVRNNDMNKLTSFTSESSITLSIPEKGYLFDDKCFYIKNNKLYFNNVNTNTNVLIDDCEYFVANEMYIAYYKTDSIVVKYIDTLKTKCSFRLENEIYYFNILYDKLYTVERKYNQYTYDGLPIKIVDGENYKFSEYDLDSCKILKSKKANYKNDLLYITVCSDVFFFYYDETQTINNVSLNDKISPKTLSHPDVKYITSNSDELYFVSEKTESTVVIKTVNTPYNGIWKFDLKQNVSEKISEECECDQILATDNYLYTYTIDYVLPRGIANLWIKGYILNQIAI